MRIDVALQTAAAKLRRPKSFTPRLDAEVILAHLLRVTREHLATYPEQQVTAPQQERFRWLIKQRERGVPVAYLTGSKEFFGLDFLVNRHVLIPRPESEALVEAILALVTGKRAVTIADIGTGSGNLAIAISRHLPQATVYAVDQSQAALAVARRNAKRLSARVRFFRGDLLSPLTRVPLDVIVANLPYLPRGDNSWVSKPEANQLKHEPIRALYSDADGLGYYRTLLQQVTARRQFLRLVVCEIDARQSNQFIALATQLLPHYRCTSQAANGVSVVCLQRTRLAAVR